jgi:hypothetical protein
MLIWHHCGHVLFLLNLGHSLKCFFHTAKIGEKQIARPLISYTFAALFPGNETVGYGAFDFWILLKSGL